MSRGPEVCVRQSVGAIHPLKEVNQAAVFCLQEKCLE